MKMKRIVSLVLCVIMLCSLAGNLTGCGKSQTAKRKDIDITFPLEEELTITFMIRGVEDSNFKKDLAENKLFKRIKEETNINMEFIFLGNDPENKLTLLINSGNYGDVLLGGPILNAISASRYFASGIFQDMTDYVNEEYMPNLSALIEKEPEIVSMIASEDGKIYTLPYIDQLEGNALESPFWINKKWLDKLGLEVPTTIDEFTNVLRAFRDQDPNGNGIEDEIPYLVCTNNEFYSLDAIYGCWGLAFKDGDLDGFSGVKDGKVYFGPTQEAFKEAVKYQAFLYDESLMWNECYTASQSTSNSKLTSDICTVGCFTSVSLPKTEYVNDYVCMVPPKVEGYDACWYVNPALVASKDRFYITDKCQYPDVVCKLMDYFYDFDNAWEVEFGAEEDGRWYTDENGNKVVNNKLTITENSAIDAKYPTFLDLVPRMLHALTREGYETVVNNDYRSYSTAWKTYSEAGVLNQEIWPRPYYSNKDANTVYRLSTDIFYQVDTYRAKWITGQGNIDEEWDDYLKKLDELGLKQMTSIMQSAYDSYLKNAESASK